MVGEAVSLANQPVGSAVFIPMAPVSTDATGNFHVDIKPEKRTVYKAGYGGLTPEPTVTVLVKHKIGLKGRRAGGKVYLTGAVGPRHPRRVIVIQKKSCSCSPISCRAHRIAHGSLRSGCSTGVTRLRVSRPAWSC